MLNLGVSPNKSMTLVEQVESEIRQAIEFRLFRAHSRLPSIREYADSHHVSKTTVVEAYDKLVAKGYIYSRPGSGFYVATREELTTTTETAQHLNNATDVTWLLRNSLESEPNIIKLGSGFLPHDWLCGDELQKGLKELARKNSGFLTEYGDPRGYILLRQFLQSRFLEYGIKAESQQILITSGVSQALDLICRLLLKPGDTVMVDDPGYYILFGLLKAHGVNLVGVKRTQEGPDIEQLEAVLKNVKPKLFFTNSVLQNPTGCSTTLSVAHRLLQIAEKHGFYIVEDDIYGDFAIDDVPRLASLDQLQRVLYVSSYSKTISGALRVGCIAGRGSLIEQLLDLQMLSSLTTSPITQRLLYEVLVSGRYRKHLHKVNRTLVELRAKVISILDGLGFEVPHHAQGGYFLWSKLPEGILASDLAVKAKSHGLVLAPGNLFSPGYSYDQWMRFNVAAFADEEAEAKFARFVKQHKG